ncbi:MAG: TonB-dependent receptor domain-containing protein [Flavisolibacter sp.]
MKYTKYLCIILMSIFSSVVYAQSNTTDTTVSFKVAGTCAQCKQRIQKSLKIKGVRLANWNVETKMLTVTYAASMISVDQLYQTVAKAGHDTEKNKATDESYKALPECCHYREMTNEDQMALNDTITNSNQIKGIVLETNNGQTIPLAGASIIWLGAKDGAVTNPHGEFLLTKNENTDQLVISYAGFKTDTVSINGLRDVQVTMSRHENLSNVIVTARQRSNYVDTYNPFRTNVITKKELLKAACCNLSESFETNPSVDVSYSDAATGSKQIQLLGLAGIYTQLTVENLPGPRGIATPLGLNSIAGPWVESIQLIKGTGSVVNGFESIAGQINVELRKPQESEKLYLNGYVNDMGKTDVNVNWSHKLNSKWSTGFLLHDDFLYTKADFNKDGFRDLPTGNQFNGVHRWQYMGESGLMSQFGIKVLLDDKTGGEVAYNPKEDKFSTNHYGLGIRTNRYEAFGKVGYVFPEKIYKSVGLELSAFSHQQYSYFGLTKYDARQKNFYSNLIYQSRIQSDAHKFKTGISFLYDNYKERLNVTPYNRTEVVPGAFAEYTFTPSEKLDVVAGLRADNNSLYGWFATPRLNIRYALFSHTTIRLNAGRGQRTANIFAENIGVLVSSRQINIINAQAGKAYGLDPEVAWNKGISIDQKFHLFGRDGSFGANFYRNDFTNQVVIDLENPRGVNFYNLNGKSYSNSFQTELSFMPAKKLELRLAYRFFDVKTNYGGKLLEKPFTAKHRAFANLAYDLNGWKIDYTINVTGRKRIPSTAENPAAYRLVDYSPSYITMNAQVSKSIGKEKLFDFYIGGENLANYFQNNTIIAAAQPFGNYFDASMIWGPVSGRLIYGGFRFTIR